MGRAVGTQLSRGACSWGKEAWWGRVLIGRVPRGVEKSLDPQRLEGQRWAWPAMGVASEGRGALTSTRPSHPPIPSDTPSAPPAAGLGPELSPCLCRLTPFLPGVRWGSGCLSTQFECVFDLTGQILLGHVSHVHSDMLCCCIPM